MYDAIVVGLGPAGSTATYNLAKSGLRVLGIDKDRFPRYKSCGGCISTKIEETLDFDISNVVEDTVYGATFTYKAGRMMDILSDRPVGYNVMRDTFDNHLLTKAKEAGTEIIEGCRVKGIEQDSNSVTVTCANGSTHSARFLIGADGASGFTGRDYFNLNHKECAVSITAEIPYDRNSLDVKGKLFIDFGGVPSGYAWIFPKKEFLSVGIAGDAWKVGGSIKQYFNSFVEKHEILRNFRVEERTGWTVPIFYGGASKAVKGRVLLAGDTGHLVDPFLGEGIYYAIVTGREAAKAVAGAAMNGGDNLSSYQRWLDTKLFPDFEYADKVASLVYNHPRIWYGILEKSPDIMRRYYNVIRGEESNESFYGWILHKVKSKPWKALRKWVGNRFLNP